MSTNNKYFSGTSGLLLPYANKQAYPAEFQNKSRLTFYASLFNSIEINSSFYKTPMASTVKKWAESVPDNFKFTFKLSKQITHNKGLVYDSDQLNHFMQTIDMAGDKKGSLLVQFPPSLKIGLIRQLEMLVADIRQTDPKQLWDIALEFRDKSWYTDEIYELLNQYQMGIVLQDMPTCATPFADLNANFIYLRFHGPSGNYKDSYTHDFLYEYAQYVKGWMDQDKTVYAYFNNTIGDAIKNLNTLNQFIGLSNVYN